MTVPRPDPGPETAPVRVDRWLWSVRLATTRTDATQACTAGHVTVDGRPAKPATKVGPGAMVEARLSGRLRIVEVIRPIDKRVGAVVAVECYRDESPPPPERDRDTAFGQRDRGTGRPTKRDRRQIDRTFGRRA